MSKQIELPAPEGWLYDWTHSSALGKPTEEFTSFTTDEAYAKGDRNARAVYTEEQVHAAIAAHEEARVVGEPVAWTVAGDVRDWSRDFSKYKTQHYVRPVFLASPPAPLVDKADVTEQHRELFFATYLLLDSVCEDHPAIGDVFNIEAHGRVCNALAQLDAQYGVDGPDSVQRLAATVAQPATEAAYLACTTCGKNKNSDNPNQFCSCPTEAEQAEAPSESPFQPEQLIYTGLGEVTDLSHYHANPPKDAIDMDALPHEESCSWWSERLLCDCRYRHRFATQPTASNAGERVDHIEHALEMVREALTEFRQEDDYLVANDDEAIHTDTLRLIVRAALASKPPIQGDAE